jgi:hypothetical protein
MANSNDLLKSEYSLEFDEIRKKMMQTSYFKFGAVKDNYKTIGGLKAIPSLKAKLQEYIDTGNTEFLCDVANFAMIEFMYPQHSNTHYKATDGYVTGRRTTVGISVNEMRDIKEGNGGWWLKY